MSVGGKIIEVISVANRTCVSQQELSETPVANSRVWVNTDDGGDLCAVYVDPAGEGIVVGDWLWWQGDKCYWTPEDRSRADVELEKIGYSGVSRP